MKAALTLLLLGAVAGAAYCAPYVPKDDSQVLEQLPGRRDDPAMAELRRLRAALAAAPGDANAAAELAQRYFGIAGAGGDPRYAGYAAAGPRAWRGDQRPA